MVSDGGVEVGVFGAMILSQQTMFSVAEMSFQPAGLLML